MGSWQRNCVIQCHRSRSRSKVNVIGGIYRTHSTPGIHPPPHRNSFHFPNNVWQGVQCNQSQWLCGLKADSRIACRAHAVALPCCAAKGSECVFPIWFTQCGRVWFTLAMPSPCRALTMPFFSRPRHSATVQRRPVGDVPANGFFRLPRGIPGKLLSEAYWSQLQVASVKPNNVCHRRGKTCYFGARTRVLVRV